MADPFIASSTMVKRVVRTVAFSSIRSALLVCLCVYKLQRTTVLFLCHPLAQSVTMSRDDCEQCEIRANRLFPGNFEFVAEASGSPDGTYIVARTPEFAPYEPTLLKS